MILPDIHLLVYAVAETSHFHEQSRQWWDRLLSSTGSVGLCYPTILGFIRLTTSRRIFESPLSIGTAVNHVEHWLEQPNARLLVPTTRHWPLLAMLLRSAGTGANLTTGAHLAALAIEHGCTLHSNDGEFERFEGLRWENPLRMA